MVLGLALRCECSPTVKYPPLQTVQQKIDAWKERGEECLKLARQQVDIASQQLLLAKQQNAPQQLQDSLTQLNEAEQIQREFQNIKEPNEQLISGLERQQKNLMIKQKVLLEKQRQLAKEQIEYELEQKRSLSPQTQTIFPPFELTLSEELLVSVLKTSGTYLSGALCIMFDSESQGFPSALARIFRRVRIPLTILLCSRM